MMPIRPSLCSLAKTGDNSELPMPGASRAGSKKS